LNNTCEGRFFTTTLTDDGICSTKAGTLIMQTIKKTIIKTNIISAPKYVDCCKYGELNNSDTLEERIFYKNHQKTETSSNWAK
jgi:hypothetical protein